MAKLVLRTHQKFEQFLAAQSKIATRSCGVKNNRNKKTDTFSVTTTKKSAVSNIKGLYDIHVNVRKQGIS
jgi:hypothetical protein